MKHKRLPPEGLWISPDGERISVLEHLIEIYRTPERFDLTRAAVGYLPEIPRLREIAEGLIRFGWVRFRYLSGTYLFEVRNGRAMVDTIEDILFDAEALGHERVSVSQLLPRREFEGTVEELYDRSIFRYQENPRRNRWRFS